MNDINYHRISVFIYFLLFIPVFYPAWESLALLWNGDNGDYSHGFLILIISAYLLIKQLSQRSAFTGDFSYLCLIVLTFLSFVWSLTLLASIQIGYQLLIPCMLLLSMTSLFGIKNAKSFIFPSLYLIFAIPIWGVLTVPLQMMAVFVNTHLLGLINIPAFIDGFYVSIPAGTFEVAGGCSGVRYLMVSLSLFSLYAFDNYNRWSNRIILVVVAIVVGIATNWIRIFIIIVAGQATNMESSLVKDHDFFGWIVFAVALIPLFIFAIKLPNWLSDKKLITESNDVKLVMGKYTSKPYFCLGLATFTIPLFFLFLPVSKNILAAPSLLVMNTPLYESEKIIEPDFKGADFLINKSYFYDGVVIQVSVSSYIFQAQGKELIHWGNENFIKDWIIINEWNEIGFIFYEVVNIRSNKKILISKQYHIGGLKTSNKKIAKLYEILKPLMKSKVSSAIYVAIDCKDDCSETKATLSFFIENKIQLK
jgi:exosortase A